MKKGFTLAEVLVTLGVLGVLAAMTLPSIINSTASHKFEVSAKKNFSLLSNAFELANIEGEAIADTNLKADRTVFSAYVKLMDEDATADTLTLKDGSVIDFSNDGFVIVDINGESAPNVPNYDQLRFNIVDDGNGGFDVVPQSEDTGGTCDSSDTTYACTAILVYGLDGLFY